MLVYVVYMPDAEKRGPDLARMNRVEEVPDEVGRVWLGDGTARPPTDEEAAAFGEQQQERTEALSKLTKAELLKRAEDQGVEVPYNAKKDDLVTALTDHAAQRADSGSEWAEPVGQAPVVTVAPGAGEAPARATDGDAEPADG